MARYKSKETDQEKGDRYFRNILFIGLLYLISTIDVQAATTECSLTGKQESVMHLAASLGEPHNLSETMVAIAMQESNLGKWNIALGEESFGPFHVRLNHVIKDLGWKNTPFNRNRAAQMMLDNPIYAGQLAIRELLWWQNYHKGSWSKATSSYNGGHAGNPDYTNKIRGHIRTIRQCGWLER